LLVIYTPPLNPIFKTTPIGLEEWVIVIAIGMSATLAAELWKVISKKKDNNEHHQRIC